MSTEELLTDLQDNYGSVFVQIDNGWRMGPDGERMSGWTCRIVDCGADAEETRDTIEWAVEACMTALEAKRP